MKLNRFLPNTFAGLAGASLWFAALSLRHADASETNAAASPATNGISIKISAGHENSPSDNYYGLPKEVFDRLTPEQVMEMAQARQKTFGTERLPDMIEMIVVPVGMFSMIAVCVWLGVSGRQKRSRMLHDTLRLMIEKGQPIPPELLQPTDPQRRPRSDLRTGLVLVSIGIGVGVMLLLIHHDEWPGALIPLLMGVAFLITWKIEANKNGQPK